MNRVYHCSRCGQEIKNTGKDCDYVFATDFVTREYKEGKLLDLKGNPTRKAVRVQKTGLVCSKCFKPTDKVIWGTHKV